VSAPLQVLLVCGGKWHDFDFARVELLKLLGEHPALRTRVAEDYRDVESIAKADLLVSYTCDVRPSDSEEQALLDYLEGGGRWLALHGTNSALDFLEDGRVSAPRCNAKLMRALGSQFIAHPPIARFSVRNVKPDHPLVAGIEDFEVEEELYLSELHGELEVLLETRYTGKALGFVEDDWPDDDPRPVMYLHAVGEGQVLYNTMGHCRGEFDMRPVIDHYPRVERCAWEEPVFYELLRRSIRWGMGEE
jgi:hypothetical protein